MALDDLGGGHKTDAEKSREKWIGVYIGIVAVLLAFCSMGGGNATKDAARANLDAANTWAFFQAKNIRRSSFQIFVDDLEMRLKAETNMPAAARAIVEKKIADYKTQIARYTSDKQRNEGLDELWVKAKAFEGDRDIAAAKDPYFDWGQALLQIAIVIGSIALITGGNGMLVLSMCMSALGTFMTLNGFFLFIRLPFIG